MDDNRINGISHCGFHGSHAVVPPVADPSVYIVTRAFIFRLDCELMFPEVWSGRSRVDVFGWMSASWVGQGGGERES